MHHADNEWRHVGAYTGGELEQHTHGTGHGQELDVLGGYGLDTAAVGVLISVGYLTQYAVAELAPGLAESYPWFPAPLWGAVATVGMACSAVIGHRASRKYTTGEAARSAGIRVFLYWMAVVVAAFVIPLMAGMWTNPISGTGIALVTVGIVSLGYVLFGIMHRPVIAAVGVGIAGAFYVPAHLAGDVAPVVSAAAMLAVAGLGAFWLRRSGVACPTSP